MTYDEAIAILKQHGIWLDDRSDFGLVPGIDLGAPGGARITRSRLTADDLEALAVLMRASESGPIGTGEIL